MRLFRFITTLCFLLALTACGGSNQDTGTITSVTATCNPTTISSGQTSQCAFTLGCTGKACSTGVNWSANAGSINASGLFTGPQTDATIQVTITATSMLDSGKFGSTIVIVNP